MKSKNVAYFLTRCIKMFPEVTTINSEYSTKYQPACLCNGDAVCILSGGSRIFKCYIKLRCWNA
jgi:hypothetical protein